MSNQSIEKYKQYLKNQNDDFLQDGRRVEGIIRDIFPEDKSLISLLITAWKAGVVSELRHTANLEVTIAQFGDRLCKEYSMRESSALTAVRVWSYALGVSDVVPNINFSSTTSMGSQSSIATETKKCPFCAEEIKKDARKCKHCHSDISDDTMVNEAQNKELIRQQKTLEREKQKLQRDHQEIERMTALESARKKLEAERSELERKKKQPANVPRPTLATARETNRDGRFIAYDNGTVMDTKTNLMWAAKDNGSSISWHGTKQYCESYRGGGYTDWRMPTLDEVAGIYDGAKSYQGHCNVHLTQFIVVSDTCAWTSDIRGSDVSFFSFFNGTRYWDRPSLGNYIRALPVRSGK